MNKDIKSAVETQKDGFKAQATKQMQAAFDRIVAKYTDRGFGRAFSDFNLYPSYAVIKAVLVNVDPADGLSRTRALKLDAALVEAAAEAAAQACCDELQARLEEKVAGLENVTVKSVGGGAFEVTGTKNGKAVAVSQQTIINVSSKGKLFNQFPARIYVEGKLVPAAKFAAV